MEQPPLGLKPRWLHIEHRITEIEKAVERYRAAQLEVPVEWYEEYFDLSIESRRPSI
jgi:hypothetical protein